MSIDGTFTEPRQTRGTLALSFGLATMATLFLFGLLAAGPAHAATFTVNSTVDPGDGICDATECTLREAISAANNAAGADTVKFNIPGNGPHTIPRPRSCPRSPGL